MLLGAIACTYFARQQGMARLSSPDGCLWYILSPLDATAVIEVNILQLCLKHGRIFATSSLPHD